MPTASPTVKRNPIPAGEQILYLVSVESVMQPSFNDPNVQVPRWVWQFKAKAKDPETGENYEFRQYTGEVYGNKKAGLTLLLDQMLPTWTDEQKETIDTDKIIGTFYTAHIRHEKADKAGDPPKPRLLMIQPAKKGAAPAAKPAEDVDTFADGEKDPFDEE